MSTSAVGALTDLLANVEALRQENDALRAFTADSAAAAASAQAEAQARTEAAAAEHERLVELAATIARQEETLRGELQAVARAGATLQEEQALHMAKAAAERGELDRAAAGLVESSAALAARESALAAREQQCEAKVGAAAASVRAKAEAVAADAQRVLEVKAELAARQEELDRLQQPVGVRRPGEPPSLVRAVEVRGLLADEPSPPPPETPLSSPGQSLEPLVPVLFHAASALGVLETTVPEGTWRRFCCGVAANHREVPYHGEHLAAAAVRALSLLFIGAPALLAATTHTERLALLIAVGCAHVGHPGATESCLVARRDPVVAEAGHRRPLSYIARAVTFALLRHPRMDCAALLTPSDAAALWGTVGCLVEVGDPAERAAVAAAAARDTDDGAGRLVLLRCVAAVALLLAPVLGAAPVVSPEAWLARAVEELEAPHEAGVPPGAVPPERALQARLEEARPLLHVLAARGCLCPHVAEAFERLAPPAAPLPAASLSAAPLGSVESVESLRAALEAAQSELRQREAAEVEVLQLRDKESTLQQQERQLLAQVAELESRRDAAAESSALLEQRARDLDASLQAALQAQGNNTARASPPAPPPQPDDGRVLAAREAALRDREAALAHAADRVARGETLLRDAAAAVADREAELARYRAREAELERREHVVATAQDLVEQVAARAPHAAARQLAVKEMHERSVLATERLLQLLGVAGARVGALQRLEAERRAVQRDVAEMLTRERAVAEAVDRSATRRRAIANARAVGTGGVSAPNWQALETGLYQFTACLSELSQ